MNLLTVKEAAVKLGVSARRVHQLIEENTLKAQKVGSYYIIQEKDLEGVTIHGKAGRPKKEKTDEPKVIQGAGPK
jgi:excisionase family DNA binding protein